MVLALPQKCLPVLVVASRTLQKDCQNTLGEEVLIDGE